MRLTTLLGIAACLSTLTGGTKLKRKHMRPYQKHLSWTLLAGSIGVACNVALSAVALAQEAAPLSPQTVAEPKPQPPATPRCEVDLRIPGLMSGIISSVLTRAEHKPGAEVRAFLKDAERRYATGDDMLKAAAEHFKIDQKKLASLVDHWRHINCEHAAIPGYAVPDAGREATTGETLSPVPVWVFAAEEATPQVPPYRSSVVGTDFDFITESDPNTFDR